MSAEDLWAPFTDKYQIHQDTYDHFNRVLELELKPMHSLSLEEMRAQVDSASVHFSGNIDFPGTEKELIIPSPYSEKGIPVSVYKPSRFPEKPPIWVFFHGGGFISHSRKTHETALKIIARDSGAIVVNVEYRLLPLPDALYAPFDDALVATQWVLKNKETVGGHIESKVGVGGDSAGGHIAGGLCNVVSSLDFQILIYPGIKTEVDPPSVTEFANVPGLGKEALQYILDNSVNKLPDQLTNPRINPIAGKFTSSFPQSLVFAAQMDPLRDGILLYVDRLKEAGVKVTFEMIQGVPHGFFPQCNTYRSKCPEVYAHITRFLGRFQR